MSLTIRKVAVAGASGNLGPVFIKALLESGFDVTALTRVSSKATFGEGVNVVRVDYEAQDSLVAALAGHDAVIVAGVGM